MRVKPYYSPEAEIIADLKHQFLRHPQLQANVRFSPRQAAGATSLGFYRGRHAGVFDAYRTLKKAFPKAAKALLDAYGMTPAGDIRS